MVRPDDLRAIDQAIGHRVVMQYAIILSVAGLAAIGQFWLKRAMQVGSVEGYLSWPVLVQIGAAGLTYVVAFGLYLIQLVRHDVSASYPLTIGATLLAIYLVSWLMLGETITLTRTAGFVLVGLGMVIIQRG